MDMDDEIEVDENYDFRDMIQIHDIPDITDGQKFFGQNVQS